MFSHIMVGTNDLAKSKAFYDATLGVLGVSPGFVDANRRAFYRTKTGTFGVTQPIDGAAASFANGGTIGFACESADQVRAWHETGVKSGGSAIEDPPGQRGESKMFLAYLRDPDGNKLCAMYRMP